MADARTDTTNGEKPRKAPRRRAAAARRRAAKKSSSFAALNGNARAMIEGGANRAYRQGRRMAKRAYAAAGDAVHTMRMPARRDIESFAEQNPLVLGAVGLGLGVVIGTLLPRYGDMMPVSSQAPRRPAARRRKR
jgi:hypothetical protein